VRRLLAAAGPFYVFAGVMHFLIPRTYMRIMPRSLPAHRELVYASGVAEIVGGAALMHPDPAVRRFGGYWETATMLAVFPANLNMYVNNDQFPQIPRWTLLLRLPVQVLFIAWALASAKR
jgi:uncharacterized membrane protein